MNALPHFSWKLFQLRHSKMCKKLKFVFFKGSTTEPAFDLKVVSKPFSKMYTMSDFGFTQFCVLCPAFRKNIFSLFTKKCAKKIYIYIYIHFQTLRTFVFDFKVASKSISKILSLANFKMKPFWRLRFAFLENGFNFVPQNCTKKVKNITFEP